MFYGLTVSKLWVAICYELVLGACLAQASTSSSLPQSNGKGDDYQFSVSECEGTNNCATWQFTGGYGTGSWSDGESAVLTITNATKTDEHHYTVKIHRVDTGGKNRGYKADYDGVIVNGQMAGTYKSYLKGTTDEGVWHAVPKDEETAVQMPKVIKFCDVNCITFQLVDGHYAGIWSSGGQPAGWSETLTVLSFTRDAVVLRRTLTGPIHFTVTYKGQIAPDGNSIINARNPFCCGPGQPEFASFIFNPNGANAGAGSQGGQGGITLDQLFKGAQIVEKGVDLILQYQRQNPPN
jgi:hypothetical protein